VPQAFAAGVATPADLAGLAAAVRAAAERGAALRVRGAGSWWPDADDDETLSTAALDTVSDFNPADLVVTVGAGVPLGTLAATLASRGVFLALDPPGAPTRTVGGVLATGGSGPLAALYGTARDQVLGLAVVAGNGTVLRLGGRVVKNVAGFDLAKLVIGGHGAFGVIAEAHLRLRALPATDRTEVWTGGAEWAQSAAARVLASGATSAALEVTSPELSEALGWGRAWALAARSMGGQAAVDEELPEIRRAAAGRGGIRSDGDAAWFGWRRVVGGWPALLRIGADPASWSEAVELARRHLGPTLGASITGPRGTVRVGAERLDADAVRALRAAAAARGWPVMLERADAATRSAVGIWGALPEGAARLARELRALFDPNASLIAPLFS
jgi:glycolate oxidase FAD binding subunit